ncbi:HU family DNA-binding protein [Ketobacter sp. MCCC 1A13808]|uniref:HU family DNA-binding protein n=1 Tax=Ketobacter sp. MCCC 1A13808 TaxID=2602738 RepID=UPI0012EB8895|nr:HU family DNA-binding protein [Ketobacter sp. MCCC 1A13808]MVF13700.1 HU family DNA-binding protein [Ketobacter sp. MCCC 1A13808]
MQKSEVESLLAEKLGLTKIAARDLLNVILDQMTLEMSRGNRISLPGFGVFEVRAFAPRTGRNPQTGEPIEIPAGHNVQFKPGKGLKDLVAQSLAQ